MVTQSLDISDKLVSFNLLHILNLFFSSFAFSSFAFLHYFFLHLFFFFRDWYISLGFGYIDNFIAKFYFEVSLLNYLIIVAKHGFSTIQMQVSFLKKNSCGKIGSDTRYSGPNTKALLLLNTHDVLAEFEAMSKL